MALRGGTGNEDKARGMMHNTRVMGNTMGTNAKVTSNGFITMTRNMIRTLSPGIVTVVLTVLVFLLLLPVVVVSTVPRVLFD